MIISNGITSIGDNLFLNDHKIESVSLPSGVKSIGEDAFCGCLSLTQIDIPDTVTSIGDNAFDGCESLTQIHIPDTVTSIGDNAFGNCKNLTQIHITDTVTSIGKYAFGDCHSLTQIHIPDTVTSIGEGAFYGCFSLTKINIPDTVTSIGEYAFLNCVSLTSIKIPSGVKLINQKTFQVFPKYIKDDGFDLYLNPPYPKLSSIEIPANVKSIGDSAFNGCTNLKDVYYHGIRADISIDNNSNLNGSLVNATWHTIAIDRDSLELTVGGSTGKLTAKVTVAQHYNDPDTVSDETVTWTSSDPSVATVDENGVVTAKSGGKAVITASAEDGRNYNTCEVTVKPTVTFDTDGGSPSGDVTPSTESTTNATTETSTNVITSPATDVKNPTGTAITTTHEDSAQTEVSVTTTAIGMKITTTTEKDASGAVTKTTTETEFGDTTVTATETTDGNKTTEVLVTPTVKKNGSVTVSTDDIATIGEVAGADAKITVKVSDTIATVTQKDIKADKTLTVFAIDKDGKTQVMTGMKVTVASDSSLTLSKSVLSNDNIVLLNAKEAEKVNAAIAKTVKLSSTKATVKTGKKTSVKLSSKCNTANIKSITYKSLDTKKATVSKKGKITAKRKGTVKIRVYVTLLSGKKKTLTLTVKIK